MEIVNTKGNLNAPGACACGCLPVLSQGNAQICHDMWPGECWCVCMEGTSPAESLDSGAYQYIHN